MYLSLSYELKIGYVENDDEISLMGTEIGEFQKDLYLTINTESNDLEQISEECFAIYHLPIIENKKPEQGYVDIPKIFGTFLNLKFN